MFERNGIIYGSEAQEPLKVECVKVLPDRMMLITFNSGETRLFDATLLRGKAFEPLQESSVYNNPVIDHGVVTWKDGEIDCSPEYMYENSYEYSMVI